MWLLAADNGPPWEVIIPALVTLAGLVMLYVRPTKDTEARTKADAALNTASVAERLVEGAMAMAKQSEARAEAAERRCEECEGRIDTLRQRVRACEDHCAQLRAEAEQYRAEAEGLAEIVDERVIGGAATEPPP